MLFSRKHPIGGMVLFLLIFWVPVAGHAGSEVELNGFQLWQLKSAVQIELGKPFKTIKTDRSTMEAHQIGPEVYMVFDYMDEWPNNIAMIQVTGSTDNMLPFKGIKLGDDAKIIKKNLGPTSRVKQIQQPKVQQWSYKKANYSVEIDAAGKLYSIQIHVPSGFLNEVSKNDRHWEDFKQSVLDHNVPGMVNSLRPDVEVYKGGTILSIEKSMAKFRNKPDPAFLSAFFGKKDSILAELKQSKPEHEMRIHEKLGMGLVYKFYKGKILREIVFFPYNGRYRIYEVAFRGACGTNPKNSADC